MRQVHRLAALALLLAVLPPPPAAVAQLQLNRLIVVSADGTSPQNGDRLLAALAGITSASEDNRYVVRLQPGSYFCSSTVFVPSFVTLEGAGTEATRILGSAPNDTLGILNLASDSELRHLYVQNRWGSGGSQPGAAMIAVSAVGLFTPVERVRLVDVVAQGLSVQPTATFGVKATSANIEVLRSTLTSELSGSAAGTTATGSVAIAYSTLLGGGVSGNVSCRYSLRGFATPVDENCV